MKGSVVFLKNERKEKEIELSLGCIMLVTLQILFSEFNPQSFSFNKDKSLSIFYAAMNPKLSIKLLLYFPLHKNYPGSRYRIPVIQLQGGRESRLA